MASTLRHPATLLWLLLAGATILSWFLSGHSASNHALATVSVILIALAKIRLIIWYFMEIRHAPAMWRWIFDGWLAVVGIALIALYLALR